jgi:type IV pilus assembly protein PilV
MRARGMTMVEVLVALLIATVGLVGALAMSSSMIAGTTQSRQMTEATVLAQSKMEEQQLRTSPLPAFGISESDGCDAQLTCSSPTPTNAIYTRTVTWGPDSPDGLSTAVTVAVSWNDSAGRPHAITVADQRVK